tara:strand:- start:79 stop:285 length:207 start_codon:yes stop_codon:yes gene_type:complete
MSEYFELKYLEEINELFNEHTQFINHFNVYINNDFHDLFNLIENHVNIIDTHDDHDNEDNENIDDLIP